MLKLIAFFLLAGFLYWVFALILAIVCIPFPSLVCVFTFWGWVIRVLLVFWISKEALY